jgi:hypothetical protein
MKQHQSALRRLSGLVKNKKENKKKKQICSPPSSYTKSSPPINKTEQKNLLHHLLSHRHPQTTNTYPKQNLFLHFFIHFISGSSPSLSSKVCTKFSVPLFVPIPSAQSSAPGL